MKRVALILLFVLLVGTVSAGEVNSTTQLYLPFNGSYGCTTFFDQAPYPHTITRNGDTNINATYKKFGSGSAYFDGTGDYLTYENVNLSQSTWSWAAWLYPTNGWTVTRMLFSGGANGVGAGHIHIGTDSKIWYSQYGGADLKSLDSINQSFWHYIVVTRSGTTYKLCVNGNCTTTTATLTVNGNTTAGIGAYSNGAGVASAYQGYMDDLVFTDGVAIDGTVIPTTEYIGTAPAAPASSASITTYPWTPDNTTRILPFGGELTVPTGTELNVTAAKDQWESASFVIKSNGTQSGINISPSSLSDGLGHTIPASAIDLRWVKVWYQAMLYSPEDTWTNNVTTRNLFPELLLKNDSLISVNYSTMDNWLWVTHAGGAQEYIRISRAADTIASTDYWNDASVLRPIPALADGENKQVWITVHVPSTQTNGTYIGNLTISNATATVGIMNLTVEVLPYTLPESDQTYGLYYKGRVGYSTYRAVDAQHKTNGTILGDMGNMKNHSIAYAGMNDNYYDYSGTLQSQAMQLRQQAGVKQDKLFIDNDVKPILSSDSATINTLVAAVNNQQARAALYGFNEVWVYGRDEADPADLLLERPSMAAIRLNGSPIWAATSYHLDAASVAGDLIDMGVVSNKPSHNTYDNETNIALWHTYGHEIVAYNGPQGGVENASVYRENYGLRNLYVGYDGMFDWVFQSHYANSNLTWNDWDSIDYNHYRDENFNYPTANGSIDTIQYEGLREGIDDTRFAQYLDTLTGSNASSMQIIGEGIADGKLMREIREDLIANISGEDPVSEDNLVASFTQSANPSGTGDAVTLTDTSTGTPDTWNWTITYDHGMIFYDRNQSPSFTWNMAGTYDVYLNVTNATGAFDVELQTHNVTSSGGSGDLVPQDIWMEGAYEQTFIVTDASSGLFLNNVTCTDSGGDTATTVANGTAWLTEPFGPDTITFTANGYNQRPIAYVFDSNATHSVSLYASSTIPTPIELSGTPKDVKFHIQSFFGAPITTANVSIQGITTTLGNWAWLAQLLSLDLDEAPINSTQMFGPTDSNGDVVFLMVDTIRYNISVTASGYTFPITYISPQTSTYTISANMNETWFVSGNNTLKDVNVSVSWVPINDTHSFVNVSYNDLSTTTTGGTISVYRQSIGRKANATPVANLTITSYNCTNSTIVTTPTGGASYLVFVNGTTPTGSNTYTFAHDFKGAPVNLPGWTSETQLWLALFVIIFTAAFAGATHSPQMGIILCVESWVFWAIGWFDYFIDGMWYTEGAILVILTLTTFIVFLWNITEGKAKGKRSS